LLSIDCKGHTHEKYSKINSSHSRCQSGRDRNVRWNAVEADANRVYENEAGKAIARAVFGKDGSHHVFLKTGATTLEIKDGDVAVSVTGQD
jgi:hypothetical protein